MTAQKRKKVWVVCVSDCEATSVFCICSKKEIALKKMFEVRDNLIKEWKEAIDYQKSKDGWGADDMYQRMIDALSSDDYEKWYNYPHDIPYFYEIELVEEL